MPLHFASYSWLFVDLSSKIDSNGKDSSGRMLEPPPGDGSSRTECLVCTISPFLLSIRQQTSSFLAPSSGLSFTTTSMCESSAIELRFIRI